MYFVPSVDGKLVTVSAIDHIVLWPGGDGSHVLAVTAAGRFRIRRETWRKVWRQIEAAGEVVA